MSSRSRRTRRIVGALALPTFLIALLVGCEFIVSNDLPTYTCTGSDPSSCPSGMFCNATTSTCVSRTGPGTDGPIDPGEGGPEIDTGPKLAAMGESCTNDSSCQSGLLCAPQSVLQPLTLQSAVCSSTCCTTADCPTGFVCYPVATGGNYCVAAKQAGRTPPADGDGGAPGGNCVSNTDCRSGLCGTDGHCVDTCCKGTDCNGGTVCKLREDLLDPSNTKHTAWGCALPNSPGISDGEQCPSGSNTDCANNNCNLPQLGAPTVCDPLCCSVSDCTAVGLSACAYGNNGGDQFKTCVVARDAGAEGAPCTSKLQCISDFCDQRAGKCVLACCKSSDCPAGEFCKPDLDSNLRCVKDTP